MSAGNDTIDQLSVLQAENKVNSIGADGNNVVMTDMDKLVEATNNLALVSPSSQASEDQSKAKEAAAAAKQERILHKQELDRLFEHSLQTQLEGIPEIDMPPLLKVSLYDYQKDGVRWLAHRENDTNSVPPFWKQRRYGSVVKWYCSIINRAQDLKPAAIRGSILADEMGLGKTYQSIALILANPPEGASYPITAPPNVPRCTLVVCPLNVVTNWTEEIKAAVNLDQQILKVGVWEGAKRERGLVSLMLNQLDVLLVTYETLASDLKNAKKNGEDGVPSIFDMAFHRIILDEAHKIRNQQTGMFKAVISLESERKLCLTGTPFNNHPNDIHSLLAFLQVEPLSHKQVFNVSVTKEIMNKKEIGLARLRTTMAHIALRRTKEDVNILSTLSGKTAELREISFKRGADKSTYEALYDVSRALLLVLKDKAAASESGGMPHVNVIFAMVHYLRAACCDAGLVDQELLGRAKSLLPLIEDGRFAGKDVEEVVGQLMGGKGASPKLAKGNSASSPKIKALLDAIKEMNPEEKGVVFSEWTSFLNIIESHLKKAGIFFTRIDGSMSREERAVAMAKFDTDGTNSLAEPRILLCSLKACGIGINLVRGNHVFLMTPFWNVAAEQQAMDRVYRCGQMRPVRVVRFVMKESVEERMLNIQSAKAALGKGSMAMLGAEEKTKARVTALYDLFEVNDEEHVDWDHSFSDDEEF